MTTVARALVLSFVGCLVAAPARAEIDYRADIAALVAAVSREALEPVVNELSGAAPALVGGTPYTFTTRSSFSGTAIDRAEQYVYEHLLSYGLDAVAYQDFPGEDGAPPGRNVLGQIDGTTRAEEIVVVGAHLDDYPWTGPAPGADDNASGVSATLLLARSFAGRRFERTIRFAFFGAEENAPWECERIGSAGYAAACGAAGDNVVAMIAADSLAFDPPETAEPIVEMNTRDPADDPAGVDAAIFRLWRDAIDTYAITGLVPQEVAISDNWSDHGSFWNEGYPAAMLIAEELDYYNPYWHTAEDTAAHFNWPFYVQVTRSYVAAAAHLAGLVGEAPDVAEPGADVADGGWEVADDDGGADAAADLAEPDAWGADSSGSGPGGSAGCGAPARAPSAWGLALLALAVGVTAGAARAARPALTDAGTSREDRAAQAADRFPPGSSGRTPRRRARATRVPAGPA